MEKRVAHTPRTMDMKKYEETIVRGNGEERAVFPRLLLVLPRSKKISTIRNLRASHILEAFAKTREDEFFVDVIRVCDDMCSDELLKRLLNDATGNFMEAMVDVDASQVLPAVLLFEGSLGVGSWVSRTVARPPASLVLSAYRVDTEEDLRTIDVELRGVALPRVKRANGEASEEEESPSTVIGQVFGDKVKRPSIGVVKCKVASGWESCQRHK